MPTFSDLHQRAAPALPALGAGYALIMRLRRSLYERGLFTSFQPPVPTLSVGNISMGGSGKTPLCSWLLGRAVDSGTLPVLLTRGYKAKPPILPYTVTEKSTAREAGDEPLMLAWSHPSAKVVVDPDRSRAAKYAQTKYRPGLFILDDGFQHLALKRNLDLVLMRPVDFKGQWNRVFPGGEWREPAQALGRADVFLVRCEPEIFAELEPDIRSRLESLGKPVFNFFIRPQGIINMKTGEHASGLGDEPYALVSGVGDPAQVARTATAFFGHAPKVHMAFKDHHGYTPKDVEKIRETAHNHACSRVLATPKDAVKLGPLADASFWTLRLSIGFGDSLFSDAPFTDLLDQAVKSAHTQQE